MVLALAGCGGDGANIGDNPASTSQYATSSPAIPDLTRGGSPVALTQVGTADVGVDSYEVVVDAQGNLTLAWLQAQAGVMELWLRRYDVVSGWGEGIRAEEGDGSVRSMKLAVDAQGNVTLVWSQDQLLQEGSESAYRTDLWARRFSAGAWQAPVKVENHDLTLAATRDWIDIGAVELAVDNADEVVLLWSQYDGSYYNLWSSRFSAGVWQAALLLDSEDYGDVSSFKLVVDGGNNILALWTQRTQRYLNLWGSRYDGLSWAAASKLDTEDLGDVTLPEVAIQGAVISLVWRQFQSGPGVWNLWALRYDGAWGTPELLESENLGDVSDAKLIADSAGRLYVAWLQSDGSSKNLWFNRYDGGWLGAQNIANPDQGDAAGPELTLEAQGGVVVLWSQDDGTLKNLWQRRFSLTEGWQAAALLESDDNGSVVSYTLISHSAATKMLLWLQGNSDGGTDLWASHYTGTTGWSTAQTVEQLQGSAMSPIAILSADGAAAVIWRQIYQSSSYLVGASYSSAAGWGQPLALEAEGKDGALAVKLLADGSGNRSAIWLQPELDGQTTRFDLWISRF